MLVWSPGVNQKHIFWVLMQGQSPEPGIREYFFYVDHNGMLFQVSQDFDILKILIIDKPLSTHIYHRFNLKVKLLIYGQFSNIFPMGLNFKIKLLLA